jgi:hypothetical protein
MAVLLVNPILGSKDFNTDSLDPLEWFSKGVSQPMFIDW